jgi:predicted metal-dependent hydrolase
MPHVRFGAQRMRQSSKPSSCHSSSSSDYPMSMTMSLHSKWASISGAGRLTLNSELIQMPKELGEFVIVHELVHLLVPNHSKVFKSFMHAYLPDWEKRREMLQSEQNGGSA